MTWFGLSLPSSPSSTTTRNGNSTQQQIKDTHTHTHVYLYMYLYMYMYLYIGTLRKKKSCGLVRFVSSLLSLLHQYVYVYGYMYDSNSNLLINSKNHPRNRSNLFRAARYTAKIRTQPFSPVGALQLVRRAWRYAARGSRGASGRRRGVCDTFFAVLEQVIV